MFNGDATDESGNHDATSSSGITYSAGKDGDAAFSDSDASYIDISSISLSDFTYSFWAKVNTSASSNITMMKEVGMDSYWIMIRSGGVNKFLIRIGASGTVSTVNYSPTGNFDHYVVTRDDDHLEMYINNVRVINNTSCPTTSMQVERLNNSTDYVEDAPEAIDQMRIFNRGITSSEVATLYNEV